MKQKKSKPFYLRWWFFVLVAVAIILILTALSGKNRRDNQHETYSRANTTYTQSERDTSKSTEAETKTPETEASTAAETAPAEAPETEAAANAETPATPAAPASGIRDDFKAAMDSYEAFINEYVDFINKYNANPTDLTLLSEYADYTSKLLDMEAKFDQWNSDDLTNEELAYYLEVQTRVSQKLIEAGQ